MTLGGFHCVSSGSDTSLDVQFEFSKTGSRVKSVSTVFRTDVADEANAIEVELPAKMTAKMRAKTCIVTVSITGFEWPYSIPFDEQTNFGAVRVTGTDAAGETFTFTIPVMTASDDGQVRLKMISPF